MAEYRFCATIPCSGFRYAYIIAETPEDALNKIQEGIFDDIPDTTLTCDYAKAAIFDQQPANSSS